MVGTFGFGLVRADGAVVHGHRPDRAAARLGYA